MTDNLVEIPIAGENNSQPASANNTGTSAAPQPAPQASPATPPAAGKTTPAIPSVDAMEQHLQQSGKLLPELRVQKEDKVDTSPLASLQPDNMVQTQGGPQPLNLPSQKQEPLAQTELATTHVPTPATATAERWWNQFHRPIKTLVAVALTAQGLYGIYKSIFFILVTYPQLDAQLSAHMITQSEVSGFATQAILIVITTVINMFFALRIFRNKATTWLNTFIGIGLFLGSTYITNFLNTNFDLISLITAPFYTSLDFFKNSFGRATGALPFIDQSNPNQTDVVWYQ